MSTVSFYVMQYPIGQASTSKVPDWYHLNDLGQKRPRDGD
jgi:hypothetical protein